MKARKGQILILTLIVMAIGMIVISPMLDYLNTSYYQYVHESNRTEVYYAADAMMEKIIGDIYRGVNIYEQNISTPANYNQNGFLGSEYDISVNISNSVPFPLPAPEGGGDWFYFDPGITICNNSSCTSSLLLSSLAYGQTHDFRIYLIGGNTVQINWATDDNPVCCWLGCGYPCNYYLGGNITIWNQNGAYTGYSINGSATNAPLHLRLNYSVLEGATGNYTIKFKNTGGHRQSSSNFFCSCSGDEYRASYSASFLAADDTDYTWVRVGRVIGDEVYSYNDYFVTVTAKTDNVPIMSINAAIRHSPGPQVAWQEQIVEIPSWQITYY